MANTDFASLLQGHHDVIAPGIKMMLNPNSSNSGSSDNDTNQAAVAPPVGTVTERIALSEVNGMAPAQAAGRNEFNQEELRNPEGVTASTSITSQDQLTNANLTEQQKQQMDSSAALNGAIGADALMEMNPLRRKEKERAENGPDREIAVSDGATVMPKYANRQDMGSDETVVRSAGNFAGDRNTMVNGNIAVTPERAEVAIIQGTEANYSQVFQGSGGNASLPGGTGGRGGVGGPE